MVRNLFVTILCLLHMPSVMSATKQSIHNQSFSYIGFAVGEFHYEESGILSSGLKFKTTPSTFNIFNQSGGYTRINKRAGFYINTVSSLSSSSETENWRAHGSVTKGDVTNSVDGIYQTNTTSSTQNELDILLSYIIAPGHQVVAGGSYTRSLMDRNSFADGDALTQFNLAHLTPAIGNADVAEIGASDSNNNGVLDLNELIATYGVNPSESIVNFTETFTSVVMQAGYFYDSRFATNAYGVRYIGGVLAGTPVYYDVVNTSNPSLSFTDSFNGINIKSYVGIGWRFNEYFDLVAKADYFYRLRQEVEVGVGFSDELQRTRKAIIPENTVQYWNLSLMAYWSFD